MEIKLPKRLDGKEQTLVTNGNQITVIGANGAGKSRFCSKVMQGFGDRAYRMSALKGIHSETYHNLMPGSIECRYNDLLKANQMFESKANTEFERLVVLLMSDEFMELIGYKSSVLLGDGDIKPPRTKLDTLVHVWQAIFPKNKILRDGARLLIQNDQDDSPYSALRLSDGEKAALYYIGATLYAPENALVMVDDPETFIHPSLIQNLWNEIEEMRPDCTFVYSTHDVQFATSRIDNKCIWVKSFDVSHEAWDYEFV
ncbi:MAG: AAA family ATPase, partial [Muribaculaceae bacterium]